LAIAAWFSAGADTGNKTAVRVDFPVMETTAAGNEMVLTCRKPVWSAVVSSPRRAWLAIAAAGVISVGLLSSAPIALADPEPEIPTDVAPPPEGGAPESTPVADGLQHNVVYRARADGTSRGAIVAYKQDDQNVNSAQPTLLPGQTFEVNTVLNDPKQAGMQVSIQWPYGSNLHCEILVDDQIVAQADEFIAPRFFHVKDDPSYGVLPCGAPLDIPAPASPAQDTAPADPNAPAPVAAAPAA
jgi:hypothetical protein